MGMNSRVVTLDPLRERDPRLPRAIDARRRLDARGRVWVNGREIGGRDPRYAHLAQTHD